MELKVIDINTIVVDGITYTAVECGTCEGCAFISGKCPKAHCGSLIRPDHRSIVWKRKTTDIQNKSSSEHTKPIDIKSDKQTHVSLSKIRQTKTYKLNFKP